MEVNLTENEIARFWRKVDRRGEDDCWNWTAGLDKKDGYGVFDLHRLGRSMRAHRVSFLLDRGFLPHAAFICHKCGNRTCVNPRHLYAGNAQTNAADTIAHGRTTKGINPQMIDPDCVPKGEDHLWSKLKVEDVRKIRKLCIRGVSLWKIAKMFNVTHGAILHIVNGRNWKSVKDSWWTPEKYFKAAPVRGLSDAQVLEIRRLYRLGTARTEMMKQFHIGQTAMRSVVLGLTYKHVPDPYNLDDY